MTQLSKAAAGRTGPNPREIINRARPLTFTFNGKPVSAFQGDSIASALAAAGTRVFSRSFKYHRPRGLMCAAGHCPNCLVQVKDGDEPPEPNVRACTRAVTAGLAVSSQNAWPSLDQDVMSLTRAVSRFLPVGFYYKTFIRPQRLWPLYEKALRSIAGLGRIDPRAKAPHDRLKQYLHGDLVVVGGGPAGLSAALAAADQGARVLLFDENPGLGGHTRFTRHNAPDSMARLIQRVSDHPRIRQFLDCSVLGYWEDSWLSAVSGKTLYKIRGKAVVFATGVYEQPLIFDNNDLPGIMLGTAVQRMMALYAVNMGSRAVIVTASDDGWRLAADLLAAGLAVEAVADERPAFQSGLVDQVTAAGARAMWQHTVIAAEGKNHISRALLAPTADPGSDAASGIDCDLLCISIGASPANDLLYQAGADIQFQPECGEFKVAATPDHIFAAGRLTGQRSAKSQLASGHWAGLKAAVYLGLTGADKLAAAEAAVPADLGPRTSTLVMNPGKGKRFVCFCEDVTDKDLAQAIAEGYHSVELLKRYSTISMGPCQGKMCTVNAIQLCARENSATVAETGTTVSRPPSTPVSLAALAGQHMEPVKVTPIHDWHLANSARMMNAGLWKRPEHYGNPLVEVKAVREQVGLIDISTLGKLRLTGPGVPALLERIYVNKWAGLEVGRVRYGLMCNDEGIVIDDGVTARFGPEEYYMTTSSGGAQGIYEWIQWWAQSGWGEGVHVTQMTDDYAAFNLAGPNARALLSELAGGDLANETFPYMHVREMAVAGVPCRLMRIGFTGELSFEIHCPAAYGQYVWDAIVETGLAHGIHPFGVEAQRVLRLEKGHIIIGQDTDALSDPFAADLGWVVKLDKEDFLGKRSLSRIAESGTAQKLVGFRMADPSVCPEEGLQIVARDTAAPLGLRIIGWVSSSRWSPTLEQSIGLCWLPRELAEQPGHEICIRRAGRLYQAAVHHGPFYDPDGLRLRM